MLYDQVSLLRAASEDGTFAISVTGDNTEVLFPFCMMYNVSEARAMVRYLRDGYYRCYHICDSQ